MGRVDFRGSKVLVCGLARSGYAAARLLLSGGAEVTVCDSETYAKMPPDKLSYAKELEVSGAKTRFGSNPDDIVNNFHYIVISPGIPIDTPFILKAQAQGVRVIGEMELGTLVCDAPIMAITGTNGKTTATTICGEIMRRYKPGSETLGNIGTAFCEKAAAVPRNAWAVLEVSSFQLESAPTFHPTIAAVLNITEDHLNRHYTMENYIALKERVFANQDAADALVLNYADPLCRDMSRRAKSRAAYFSPDGDPGLDAQCVFYSHGDVYYKHKTYSEKLWSARDMRVPFRHILEDAMAAALMAIVAGAPLDLITRVVTEFNGVEHRVEYVGRVDGVDYYNDSKATNVDSAVKALHSIDGRVILIAGGQDKKAEFTNWAALFSEKVQRLILFGETAKMIASVCEGMNYKEYQLVKGIEEAVRAAKEAAKPGDRVLLSPACASLDMFRDYEERGRLYKQYVMEGGELRGRD